MSNDQLFLAMYLFFCVIRVSTFRRRWQLPLFRGNEWFFDVHVAPDFYDGPGRAVLRRHRLLLLAPYAMESIALTAILVMGHPYQLLYLIGALVPVTIGNHVFAVRTSQREARRFAVAETTPPPAGVSLSLKTRRVADYTNPRLELLMGLLTLAALAWLVHLYNAEPGPRDFLSAFRGPILLLYLQGGTLLAKRAVVAWRAPIPSDGAEAHLAFREEARRYFTDVCDVLRCACIAGLLYLAILRTLPAPWENSSSRIVLQVAYLLSLAGLVFWIKRRVASFLQVAGRTKPAKLARSLDDQPPAGRWFCFQTGKPTMLVKGLHGYTLNLASRRTQIMFLYFAVFAGLAVAL